MKVYQINVVCGSGSTGRIAVQIAKKIESEGGQCRIAYGRGNAPQEVDSFRIATKWEVYFHVLMTRITDKHGLYSKRATKRLIEDIRNYNPDMIHIHNIHGYYVNYEMLFAFLKEYGKPVQWTLHDCWAFTGHCAYFTCANCVRWEKGCEKCVQLRSYPTCYLAGNVEKNYRRKRAAFTGVANMKLIVPSKWLKDLAEQSFLKEYPVEVIYNSIDTTVFKPTESEFREKYGLQGKRIILGVANVWSKKKGLNDMYTLSQMLDSGYAVVMVGVTPKQMDRMSRIEKSLICQDEAAYILREKGGLAISPGVANLYMAITNHAYVAEPGREKAKLVCLQKTNSAEELAQIYTAADLFVNPTHEDNYPTVNLEAQACGTEVITYDVGGCRETLTEKTLLRN